MMVECKLGSVGDDMLGNDGTPVMEADNWGIQSHMLEDSKIK